MCPSDIISGQVKGNERILMTFQQMYKKCIDQELKQSEPKSSPQNQKREITNITNSQNTKRTYCQPSEQLFPKRWPLSNRNRIRNNMNTHKVKRYRNSDTKKQRTTTRQVFKWSFFKLLILSNIHTNTCCFISYR